MQGRTYSGKEMTAKASGAITGGRFIRRLAGGLIRQCTTQGEPVDGVAPWDCFDGQEDATYVQADILQVISGAAVAECVDVMTDNAGKAITFVANGTNHKAGFAESAATGADVELLVHHYVGRIVAPAP